jgi:ketosteroid isomerase-like protein
MKNYTIVIAILITQNLFGQNAALTKSESIIDVSITYKNEQDNIKAIQAILQNQTAAWNKGDLDAFMAGYWKNDSLIFIGKSGPTYGYKNTLANYKKNYPDANYMGKLHFDIVSIKPLGKHYFFVIGKWYLKRSIGDVNGVYTLVFRKTKTGWKIISDHSS